jgi:hypothetical protein
MFGEWKPLSPAPLGEPAYAIRKINMIAGVAPRDIPSVNTRPNATAWVKLVVLDGDYDAGARHDRAQWRPATATGAGKPATTAALRVVSGAVGRVPTYAGQTAAGRDILSRQ